MSCPEEIADDVIPDGTTYHTYLESKPVFFGHYWLKGKPTIENKQAICLDYSVAKNGQLVACRLSEQGMELVSQHVV